MRPIRATVVAVLVSALASAAGACRALPGRAPASLEVRASAPVSYEAEFASQALRLRDLLRPRGGDPAGSEEAPLVDVRSRIVSLAAEGAGDAFGYHPHGKQALLVERSAATELLDRMVGDGTARDLGEQRLTTRAGVAATMEVTTQLAFVQSFRIQAGDDVLVADPNIGVTEEGLVLTAVASAPGTDGRSALALEIVSAALARPIDTLATRIPGVGVPVTLQTPLTLSQRVATDIRLAPGEALLLGGLATDAPDEFLFAMVTVEPLAAE